MTPDDDVPNPLADVELDVWLPPAPTADQIDAIVQRLAGTRTDVAAAIEVTPLPPTRAQRLRWVAAGIVIGAAAAALVAVALWPSSLDRPTDPPPSVVAPAPTPQPTPQPPPAPMPDPLPAPPDRPGGTVASPQDFRNRARLQTLEDAAREQDWAAAAKAFEDLDRNSVYYARGKKLHDDLRDEYIRSQVATAKKLAQRHDCKALQNLGKQAGLIWKEAGSAVRSVRCDDGENFDFEMDPPLSGGDLGGNPYPPTSCDADALVRAAREAGGMNQWSKMLQNAEASIKCKSSKQARQLALMAACRLGDKSKAQKYWKEFENNTGMRQVCINTIGE